jgi:hypothetical protein
MTLYVVPASQRDIPLTEWADDLQRYNIDRLFIVDEVIKAFLTNDEHLGSGILNYVQEVINNQFETTTSKLSSAVAIKAYEDEVDTMTLTCLDVCSVMKDHLQPFLVQISLQEDQKENPDRLHWTAAKYIGDDIAIEVWSEKNEPDDSGDRERTAAWSAETLHQDVARLRDIGK